MRRFAWIACVLAGACGSGGRSGPEAFVGTWAVSGTVTITYATPLGRFATPVPASGIQVISRGAEPDTIVLEDDRGCSLVARVDGDEAALSPGTVCTVQDALSATTLTFLSGKLRVDGDALALHASGDALTTGSAPGGFSGAGSFQSESTLTREIP